MITIFLHLNPLLVSLLLHKKMQFEVVAVF